MEETRTLGLKSQNKKIEGFIHGTVWHDFMC